MKLVPVESSMLVAVGYDAKTKELEAVFVNGDVWRYRNVPREVYDQLLDSDSIGSYMRQLVIDQYPDYRVTKRSRK